MAAFFPRRSRLTKGIWIIIPPLHVQGITLFPFVLVKKPELLKNDSFVRHERIHLAQQLELLILPFYLIYIAHYCWFRLKGYKHQHAYKSIIFEKEAYDNHDHHGYLSQRRLWAWLQ